MLQALCHMACKPLLLLARCCSKHSCLFTWVKPGPCLQVTNPLYLWQFWSADACHARACFARHNSMMDEKVAALLKVPPPDYTIAGTALSLCAQ